MKHQFFTLLTCIAIVLTSCSQDYRKLSQSEINQKEVQIAQSFAQDFLTALKNGSTYTFDNEAIDQIKSGLSDQNQKATYQGLKNQYGDFQSLEYAEMWIPNTNSEMKIVRLKSAFDKSIEKLEVRVVLNEENKISGFWIRPWLDAFN